MTKALLVLSIVLLTSPAYAQSTLYSNSTTGDIGIGTSAPDALLSLDGQSARTVDMIRETTASTAGNNLTLQAGGAFVGGTNLNGGALNLTSGISTGNGSSGINFNIYNAGSSGSSDNSPTTAMALTGTGLNLSSGFYQVGGAQIAASNLLNGVTGSGNIVLAISPTLTTPNIGAATGTSLSVTGNITTSGGQIGIGTGAPVNVLDLASGGGIHIASGVPGSTSAALYNNSGTLTWNGTALGVASSISGTTNYIPAFTSSSTLGNSVIYQSGSNVGIATTTPLWNFETHVATNQNWAISGNGHPVFGAINDAATAYVAGNIDASPLILNNDSGGSVGIIVTSPSYTLQVNGSVAGTSAYVNTSDVRHKKNIQPLDAGLKEVEQLRPVTFEWKDDILNQPINGKVINGKVIPRTLDPSMQGKQIGLIAQDVEQILPSVVVTEANAEKTKGMKYADLIPVLIKAVQEQQGEIQKQQVEIDELKQSAQRPTHP